VLVAGPGAPAAGRVRIPLWKSAAGRRAEYTDTHGCNPLYIASAVPPDPDLLQVGAGVRIDFGTQNDFDDFWGFPGHFVDLQHVINGEYSGYRPAHDGSSTLQPRGFL
jgi:hypothetical protein